MRNRYEQFADSSTMTHFTEAMENYFIKRTNEHIARVKQNLLKMEGYRNLTYNELVLRANSHDESKFMEPERLGYIWLTWMHYCKNNNISFSYPNGIESIVERACYHHIHNNKNLHHPEAHISTDVMQDLDMVEMVCDWTAMAQEFGKNSAKEYVDLNLDNKWHFSLEKKQFIYETIQELDKRNSLNLPFTSSYKLR